MGMAARIGDMTVHGGSVVVGLPTVLIGGMPAARLGDMHVCPMVTPGVPPIPHVGGPILLGSVGVLIGGMPAARQGDMALCVGPPDSIAMGCPTVMIGEISAGGGGGGGGGGGSGGSGSATKGAITSAALAAIEFEATEIESHFLDVKFIDKGKKPIAGYKYVMKDPEGRIQSGMLGGEIKRKGVSEGDFEITLSGIVDARWSVEEADVGDTVKVQVKTVGVEDGSKADILIFVRDGNYTDHLLATLESKISGDALEEDFLLNVDEKFLSICGQKSKNTKYSQPFFFYKINIADLTEQSALLMYKDHVEIKLKDDDGNAVGNIKYEAHLPSGEIREGTLDDQGEAKIENTSPGKIKVKFTN